MVSFRLSVLLVVVVVCLAGCNGAITASYKCVKDSNDIMTATFRAYDDTGETTKISAYSETTGFPDGCSSTDTVTVDTQTHRTIEVVTDASKIQTSPADDCTLGVSADTVTYRFIVHKADNVIASTDTRFEFICDYTMASFTGFEVVEAATPLSTSSSTPAASDGQVTITLVDSAGNALTSPVALGAQAKFKVEYARVPNPTVPLFVQITGVVAGDTNGFDQTTSTMLSANGCPADPPGEFETAAGFTTDDKANLALDTTTSVTAYSGLFEMVAFTTTASGIVYFKVSYTRTCYLTSNDQCFDSPTFCAAQRRRRRSVEDEESQNATASLTFSVKVTMGGAGATSGLGGEEEKNVSEKECEVMTSFWIVCIVLGVLLLVVLVFAVMLFYRLKREQGKKQVNGDGFGTRNPAF